MNGIDVLKEIKLSGKYSPSMKVVIFSNMNDKEERDKAFANGADGFLLKSQYSPSELVAEVKRMLSDYREQEKNEIRRRENGTAADAQNNSEEKENGKKKILFIEDEEIFLEMFGKKLEDEGYEVECATNGSWGVKEALAKNFDLIIMDMVMTAMSGEEIIERLQLEEKTKNIPIIALSATLDEGQLAKLIEKGINDYFIKTRITPSDLAKKVKEVLGNLKT
jgi:CheY-like chemotaxis protein